METAEHRPFLDTAAARILAGLIALLALAGIAYVWSIHARIAPVTAAGPTQPAMLTAPAANPAFVECRDQRVADVDRMLADGLINATQHAEYTERAIATCAGQFPPDRGG